MIENTIREWYHIEYTTNLFGNGIIVNALSTKLRTVSIVNALWTLILYYEPLVKPAVSLALVLAMIKKISLNIFFCNEIVKFYVTKKMLKNGKTEFWGSQSWFKET